MELKEGTVQQVYDQMADLVLNGAGEADLVEALQDLERRTGRHYPRPDRVLMRAGSAFVVNFDLMKFGTSSRHSTTPPRYRPQEVRRELVQYRLEVDRISGRARFHSLDTSDGRRPVDLLDLLQDLDGHEGTFSIRVLYEPARP